MHRVFVVAACAFVVVSGLKRHAPVNHYEVSETEDISSVSTIGVASEGGNGRGKSGFSAGSGLKTIAQGSAEQANYAVANQHTAARHAAFAAKSTLAQVAAGSAATAHAALIGKHVLVQKLQRDVNDAHQILQGELYQLEQAERLTAAAQQAVNQAQQALNAIGIAFNIAKGTAVHSEQAAEEAAAELGYQQAMVGAAKQKLSSLTQQLHATQTDLRATHQAAQIAEAAAHLAQSNAAQAAESTASLEHSDSSIVNELEEEYHH